MELRLQEMNRLYIPHSPGCCTSWTKPAGMRLNFLCHEMLISAYFGK